MPVHENWAQNRQATAVCDFCNHRNVPLQKCQDCNINICKDCTSKGTLENDPRHMLASEAADSFDWHKWGKGKNPKVVPPARKLQTTSPVLTRDPEYSARPDPIRPVKKYSGYSPDVGTPEYFSGPYIHPIPMNYTFRSNNAVQGLGPVGFFPPFRQYPQMPQYFCSPPLHDMYGFPAGQPSYSNCIPHHPYCVYSAQNPHLSAEKSSSTTAWAPKSSQVVLGQAESVQASPQTPFGRPAAQTPQATIPVPIQAYRSENGIQYRASLVSGSSTEPENAQCPRKSSKSQQNTQYPGSVSDESSVTIEKTCKSRQATNPGKQAVLGSKRSRESSQGFDQGIIEKVSDSTHQPVKITRQKNASQSYKNRRPALSTADVLKRSRQDIEDNDEDGTGSLPAKKSRHKYSPKTRIVKMSVSSYEGMQRLRQIFTTSQADSQSGSTIQDNFQNLTSGSESRSSFSSQPIKKPRLDGVLNAAGYQPVPWPVPDLPPQIPHKERSCQLSTKAGRAGHQGSYSGLLSQHTRTTNQVNDDEAREAATILLNMRLGR